MESSWGRGTVLAAAAKPSTCACREACSGSDCSRSNTAADWSIVLSAAGSLSGSPPSADRYPSSISIRWSMNIALVEKYELSWSVTSA